MKKLISTSVALILLAGALHAETPGPKPSGLRRLSVIAGCGVLLAFAGFVSIAVWDQKNGLDAAELKIAELDARLQLQIKEREKLESSQRADTGEIKKRVEDQDQKLADFGEALKQVRERNLDLSKTPSLEEGRLIEAFVKSYDSLVASLEVDEKFLSSRGGLFGPHLLVQRLSNSRSFLFVYQDLYQKLKPAYQVWLQVNEAVAKIESLEKDLKRIDELTQSLDEKISDPNSKVEATVLERWRFDLAAAKAVRDQIDQMLKKLRGHSP